MTNLERKKIIKRHEIRTINQVKKVKINKLWEAIKAKK